MSNLTQTVCRLVILCTIIARAGGARAQEEPAAPVMDAAPSLWSQLSTSAMIGYDSDYLLYGYTQSRHLYQASVNGYLPLKGCWSSWAGAWYGYHPDGTYQELDLYAGLDATLSAHFTAGVGYSVFNYMEVPYPADARSHEFMAHLTAQAGPASLRISDQYDTMGEGHLARAIASVRQPLGTRVAAVATVEYGYAFEYYIEGNAPQYVLLRLGLPTQLGEQWALNPFVAHSIPLAAIDDFEDELTYWGLHVDYTF